jgi:dTDP-glucose 4,6-dehydratase/UDP-glucose 4-epimerase
MNILILGSEGFIGSNAVNYFKIKKHTVHKADIVIKEEENYTVINPEHADFSSLFSKTKYDVCLNATGSANVQFSFSNPALDFSLI